MTRNTKSFENWTNWDWFVYDAKKRLADPLFWLFAILALIAISAVVVLVVVIVKGGEMTETQNSSFWMWLNLTTILRNLG